MKNFLADIHQVAKQSELRDITLVSSSCERLPGEIGESNELSLTFNAETILDVENIQVISNVTFGVKAFSGKANQEGAENNKNPILNMTANYSVRYTLQSMDQFEKGVLLAFGRINGTYNAWPFWREYLQNTVGRMGLPTMTLPLLRVERLVEMFEPKEDSSTESEDSENPLLSKEKLMARNTKMTGKKAGSAASKTLTSKSTGSKSKSSAGSALGQRKAPAKQTSKKAATAASKTLSDKRTSAASKSAAGSALAQARKKK